MALFEIIVLAFKMRLLARDNPAWKEAYAQCVKCLLLMVLLTLLRVTTDGIVILTAFIFLIHVVFSSPSASSLLSTIWHT